MTKNNVRAKKNIKKKNRAFDMTSLIIAFFIVVVSIVGVNCYIQQYEKNYEMNQLKRELAEVQNEGELMDIEYQSRANYRTIEAYVSENMSMKKISNYQIEYIDDGNNDRNYRIGMCGCDQPVCIGRKMDDYQSSFGNNTECKKAGKYCRVCSV